MNTFTLNGTTFTNFMCINKNKHELMWQNLRTMNSFLWDKSL